MIVGRIERSEIEEVLLDFGTIGDVESDRPKDRLDPLDCECDRMQSAAPRTAPWQGHIDRLLRQSGIEFGLLKRLLAQGEPGFNGLLDLIERLALRRPGLR